MTPNSALGYKQLTGAQDVDGMPTGPGLNWKRSHAIPMTQLPFVDIHLLFNFYCGQGRCGCLKGESCGRSYILVLQNNHLLSIIQFFLGLHDNLHFCKHLQLILMQKK